ncbi:hypothetical protein AcW1_007631 [Taiwanofungus camphoratus]|nr:hypothetical protein AcV5_007651 [Antrodia cinnamomea]KAI0947392.1 hypothetical protein AcV7_009833 [Antrodia cinnamomea]KAI0953401.1 hypothetical protein AcW1_007631 [Antrodia cinnamomea]
MYLTDTVSEQSGLYQNHDQYASLQRSARRPPPPPTSIALDDSFDAVTTEAPTEWNVGVVYRNRDYEESISGYQNYVNEMERKLSGEDDFHAIDSRRNSNMLAHADKNVYSESGRSPRATGGRRSLGSLEPPDNARKVSGRKGKVELVEQKVMEDGPLRTISLWRERVAESSGGSSHLEDDVRSETNNQAYGMSPSDDSRARRVVSDGHGSNSYPAPKGGNSNGMEILRTGKASYQRSEYMVAYHQPTKNGFPLPIYAMSESGKSVPLGGTGVKLDSSGPRVQRISQKPGIPPKTKRPLEKLSRERDKYMVAYPLTPPRSSGSTSASPSPQGSKGITYSVSMSPLNGRKFGHEQSVNDSMKSTSTSSVELILSSCEPSLLHIIPVLSDLGIQRLEHLRAVARLNDETRDREVKEQAIKRGITVVEWAILLDKLQGL